MRVRGRRRDRQDGSVERGSGSRTVAWPARPARVRAGAVEAALSYSSLADLLAGIEPAVLAALPAPQREALEVALLRAGSEAAVAVSAQWGRLRRRCSRSWLSVERRSSSRSTMSSGSTVPRRGCSSSPLGGSRIVPSASSSRFGPGTRCRSDSTARSPPSASSGCAVGPLSAGALHQLIKARLGCDVQPRRARPNPSRDGRQPVLRARARDVIALGRRCARGGRSRSPFPTTCAS